MRQKPIYEAVEIFREAGILVSSNVSSRNVGKISYNSKDVNTSTLFVCKGINFREVYLEEAVEGGAFCYVSEKEYENVNVNNIIVTDIRLALAYLAKWFYEYDENSPKLIGVTGTKGKSTVTYFIKNILTQGGVKCGYITTIDTYDGNETKESILTTPESLELYELLYNAKNNGCSWMVVEVSSQAEKMHRIEGLEFECGVFVNISDDHISPHEHHSFEEYLDYKGKIVSRFKKAIINIDDVHSQEIISYAKEKNHEVITYSVRDTSADYHADEITKNGFRSIFDVISPKKTFNAVVKIAGEFNVANALAACAVGDIVGIDDSAKAAAVARTRVKGRMNIFQNGKYIAIVDYAHNKHSLDAALKALKEYYPERNIYLAFGCPGEKALQRRYDMAKVASGYVKYVYITSEDPGRVDPQEIADEVKGYLDSFGTASEIILDRKTAVKVGVENLTEDDILIIAGKGSEHYQVVNGKAMPYESDTQLAEKYIMLK